MRSAFAMLERAAESDVTVLLEGETGTGKEAAAESIHLASARRDSPFVVVDCGAIPAELLESEFFGHEKGAFTGAHAARTGAFEAATGGTVFLDEIGELPLDLQPKLLRVIERHEIKRLGTNQHVPVDVRVIAATNRTLCSEVNAKRFRSDLYYRLAVFVIKLPSLRERPDDLPLLVEHILESAGVADSEEADFVKSKSFLDGLSRHSWPGNVRELRNYLERCLAMRQLAPLADTPSTDLASLVNPELSLKVARERWLDVLEREYLEKLLRRHADNASSAARAAGIGRTHFYRLLWRRGVLR
jgi:transcriptional regulator with PAS, ATPase and Fis domain